MRYLVLVPLLVAIAAAVGFMLSLETGPKRDALTFSCGYLWGQRDIIQAARLPMDGPNSSDWCDYIRDTAIRQGFTTTTKDQ
jgi:hypothetical protein